MEWLGEVPEHWDVCALKRIVKMQSGESITADGIEEFDDYPVFGGNGLRGYTSKFTHDGHFVLIGRQGALCGNINYGSGKFWASEHAIVASPIKKIDTVWLGEMMRAMNLNQYSVSAAQPGLSVDQVSRLETVVPPLAEQIAIAIFLDQQTAQIDSLISEQQRLMELLKEKRQAVISQAVTKGLNPGAPMKPSGVEWFGEVPEHWDVGPLKRYWSVTDCKHITADFIEDGIPLASIREVQSRWVVLENAKCTTPHFYELLIEGGRRPLSGDLIFSRNATVGEVAQVSGAHPPFAMGQDVVLLRKILREYSSDYLQNVIRSPIIIQQLANMMIGSTFKRINVEEIRSFIVPSPPPSEQTEIAVFLEREIESFDTLTAEAQRAIDLLQERRTALISAAVTGKIDVRIP